MVTTQRSSSSKSSAIGSVRFGRRSRNLVISKSQQGYNIPFKLKKDVEGFFNAEASDFTLGQLLGDGHIHATKYQLHIDQAIKEYSVWKKQEAERLQLATNVSKVLETSRKRQDKKTGAITTSVSYRFSCRGLFKDWRQHFYVEKKPGDPTYGLGKSIYRKCVPPNIADLFKSPYALAIFYMDDGGVQVGTAYFATGELPDNEVELLRDALKKNFNLEFTTRTQTQLGNQSYAAGLLLRRESLQTFVELVRPTISKVPCMIYKLKFK